MKKIYSYIMMMACVLMFAGCQKDFSGVFTAEIEDYDGGNSKVYIEDVTEDGVQKGYACWNDGDGVLINGNQCKVVVNSAKTETTIAMANGGDAEDFTAIYPARNATYGGAKQYTLNMPQIQVYNSGLELNAPMMAYTTKENARLVFKNLGSLMKVTVKGITSTNRPTTIAVTAVDGAKLWGEATCVYGVNGPTMTMSTDKGSNTVFLEIPTVGVPLDATETFYVVLPANITSKVKVEVLSQNSTTKHVLKSRIRETQQAITIGQNKIVPVELTLTDAGNYFPNASDANQINSAMDYVAFSKEGNFQSSNTKGKTFTQSVDIVVPSVYSGVSNFGGIYDGGGKSLTIGGEKDPSRWGMFYSLKPTTENIVEIKNLTVNVNVKTTVIYYLGGIVAQVNEESTGEFKIDGCTVNGSIEVDNNADAPLSIGQNMEGDLWLMNYNGDENMEALCSGYGIGGIIGEILSSGTPITINNCHNNATIYGDNVFSVGGIIGHTYTSSGKISNCTNTASLSGVTVGGIVGKRSGSSPSQYIYIDKCVNSGALSTANPTTIDSKFGNIGGIVGVLCKGYLLNCANHGTIVGTKNVGGLIGCYGSKNYQGHKIYVYNCYADGVINNGGTNIGGILGTCSSYYYTGEFTNVYVSERGEGRWISGGNSPSCTNVYRPADTDPSNDYNENGVSYIENYDNSTWQVPSLNVSLVSKLGEAISGFPQGYTQETWKGGVNSKPMLNFE